MIRFIVLFGVFAIACSEYFAFGTPFVERTNKFYPDGQIVGGEVTDIKDVPYQVALEYRSIHICGGSLVTEKFVVTAAHCIDDSPLEVKVRAGSSDRTKGGVLLNITKVHVHPKYFEMDYDVAVIELSQNVVLKDEIKTVPIADVEPKTGSPLKVSGWGDTEEGGDGSPILMSVVVPLHSRKACIEAYRPYSANVTERMICTYKPGQDACNRDSGGPAVFDGKLVGVVSWGLGCAQPNIPGVYANVVNPEIREFIRKHAKV